MSLETTITSRLEGLRVSDVMDMHARVQDPKVLEDVKDPNGYFTHHGGDHHSFVLFNKTPDCMPPVGRATEFPQKRFRQISVKGVP